MDKSGNSLRSHPNLRNDEKIGILFTYANCFHYLGQLMPYLVANVKEKLLGFNPFRIEISDHQQS
jgi:hypothetical protein